MASIKQIIKNILPASLINRIRDYKSCRIQRQEQKLIDDASKKHEIAIQKIRQKSGPIKVVFFALMDSVWKYDVLYQLMDRDSRFNPVILVCPVVNYGIDNMLYNMNNAYNRFKASGYNVVKSYDIETDRYVDVREQLNPDVIFYTNPYKGLIDDRYFITEYPDILTCYVHYTIATSNKYEYDHNQLLQNLVWRFYVETDFSKRMSEFYSRNKGENVLLTGYTGTDSYITDRIKERCCPWRYSDRRLKRIIWAPHHTITDYTFVNYSTFLSYYDFMFEMAEKYKYKIQIAFKPHPLLKNRLEIMWGKEVTANYYNRWNEIENGICADGAYEDLFITSDAIMHDCGSFISEYLFTGNPALHLDNGVPYSTSFNDLTQECLKYYYKAKTKEDIENFILNVIDGNDPLKDQRVKFVSDNLMPPHGKLASENIIDDLVKQLIV